MRKSRKNVCDTTQRLLVKDMILTGAKISIATSLHSVNLSAHSPTTFQMSPEIIF